MRICFLTSIVPDGAPVTGFEIANEAVVHGLRALGHEVVPFGMKLPRQGAASAGSIVVETLELENAAVGAAQKARYAINAVKTGLPISAAKLRAVEKDKLLEAHRAAGPFDATIVNSYQMAAAFPALVSGPYAYLAHNVEHVSAGQNASSASGSVQRTLYRRDARLLERIERKLVGQAAFVWTLSEDDRAALMGSSEGSAMLPLVVPEASVSADGEPSWDVGLIGTWTWEPNRVGLEWFLREVVPLLDVKTTVAVAGNVPADLATGERVAFLGRVDNAADFLASVRVVPLVSQGGTGVQLKTIEAFQAGLACVATASALRGVGALPENCRTAESAAEFAAALNESVAASRAGTTARVDGSIFRDAQREAMLEALREGLAKIGPIA